MAEKSEKKEWKKSTLRDYYETLLITMILLNFARIFVFQTFKIPTGSMIDNLLIGDHIVVNKFIYGNDAPAWIGRLFPFRKIDRGDIIVFRFPQDPDVDYVKRVVGLPGDTISMVDKQIFVNGVLLEEPYTVHSDPGVFPSVPGMPEQFRLRDQMMPTPIPEGEYFALGDNRDESYDSRYWGNVRREFIKGRPFMVYWSFRSEPAAGDVGGGIRIRDIVDVVTNFFSKTRWHRMGFIVDSEYHYRADLEQNPPR
jgi:signal peptidase I